MSMPEKTNEAIEQEANAIIEQELQDTFRAGFIEALLGMCPNCAYATTSKFYDAYWDGRKQGNDAKATKSGLRLRNQIDEMARGYIKVLKSVQSV